MITTLTLLLSFVFFLESCAYSRAEALEHHNHSDLLRTCNQIAASISGASQVFFPSTPEYLLDISHDTSSSTEASACSVEPGSAEDVSKILRIVGSTRTPFAVKCGGHASNPGFWDRVYVALEPTGVNVVGGRIPGVGVAGLTLGGGESFSSSERVDNIAGFELVLPNGTITSVTSKDEDLWFGLRGGSRVYNESQLDPIKKALFKYNQITDTKAASGVSLAYYSGQLLTTVFFFYDAPTPSGVFDDFLAIPAIAGNVTTRSFADLVLGLGSFSSSCMASGFTDDAPVTNYSSAVFDSIVNQMKFWGPHLLALDKNISLSSTLEPFDYGLFSHGSGSAYPPDRSHAIFPTAFGLVWSNTSLDDTMASAIHNISVTVRGAALADGQDVSHAGKYPNYALFDTPLEDMYGGNVERLRKIRAAIDPENVMCLTGGWRF